MRSHIADHVINTSSWLCSLAMLVCDDILVPARIDSGHPSAASEHRPWWRHSIGPSS